MTTEPDPNEIASAIKVLRYIADHYEKKQLEWPWWKRALKERPRLSPRELANILESALDDYAKSQQASN